MNKYIIIIGGGYSIQQGISLGLKEKIQDKFVIACNYAYKHFDSTLVTFYDNEFYKSTHLYKNPYIYDELKNLPLIIGLDIYNNTKIKHPNTILVKENREQYCSKESLIKGFYSGTLVGIFSLSLACFLLEGNGTIILLGFDWNKRIIKDANNNIFVPINDPVITHYYDKSEINHRGIGYVGYYQNHNPNDIFNKFNIEKGIKIYNVSPDSNINNFEKINYNKFFELLSTEKINQEDLRKEIIKKLN